MVIDKKARKICNFLFYRFILQIFIIFLFKICWHSFDCNCFCCFCNFITYNYWIINNTFCISSIFATTFRMIPSIIFFAHMFCRNFTPTPTVIIISLFIWLDFLPSNFHFHLHDTFLVNIFDSFIHVIILKTFTFKSFVLFGKHIQLDRSLRVLQLPVCLPKLTASEY